MAGKRAQNADVAAAREAPAAEGPERYGPLALRRLRKEDGRALISFALVPNGEDDREAPDAA